MVDNNSNHIGELEEIRKDKSKNTTLWIVIAIVAVLVLAVAGWWYLGMQQVSRKTENQVPSVQQPEETGGADVSEETETAPVLSEEQQAFNRYFPEELLAEQLNGTNAGWDLAMFRKLVGNAFTAEFLTEMPGMTWEKWENTRKDVLKLARSALADPGFVEWLWEWHRDTVLSAVQVAGKKDRLLKWARRAHPYFSGALPMAHSNILNEYYDIDKKLEQELKKKNYDKERIRELTVQLDKAFRKLSASGLDRDDIYLFEFSRRRLAEGGRELLQAYAAVLSDLIEHLESPQEAGGGRESS